MNKILAYVKLYAHKNKSGGELYLHRFLKGLDKDDDILVMLESDDHYREYKYDNIKIVETNEKHSIFNILQFDTIITQLDFLPKVNEFCLKNNKKVINIFHCSVPDNIPYYKNDKIIKIFNSNYVKKMALHDSNIKKMNNCFLLYPHIDFEKYNKCCNKIEDREYITFVNPQRSKGGDVVEQLAKMYPEKKFMIVKGGYYPHLQELHRYKNLSNCHIVNNTSNMIKNVYSKTRILLMPSRYETYGMCPAEAQSMGIPTIANKKSGGLVENLGKIQLYGITPEEDSNGGNISEYCKCIDLLDDLPTYVLWSSYGIDYRKKQCEIQNIQMNHIKDSLFLKD